MSKRAVVYARVSTEDQAKEGFSLGAQIEAGRKYAEAYGFEIARELIDDGISGAVAFSERPSGAVAWRMLCEGMAQVIICQNVDRLSRDVVDLLVTIRKLLRAGIEVHCLDLGRVTSEYDIMLVIRGWQGSDEREKIKERTMRGRRQKIKQGKVVATGEPPYGYEYLRNENGQVVNFKIVEEQAQIIRLIFKLYTQGDETGTYSIYRIANYLTDAGIPSLSKHKRKRPLHVWDKSTVGRILKTTTYKGEWQYTINGGEEHYIVRVPSIVSSEIWELAQVQRERNRRKARRNSKYDYLLSGIIKCGCGYSMCGKTRIIENKTYRYYYCYESYRRTSEEHECQKKFINADDLENAVWAYFVDILTAPESLEDILREAQQMEFEEQEPKRAELETVVALIAEAEAEAERLASALTKTQGVVAKTLEDKMKTLNERYDALVTRRHELQETISNQRLTNEAIESALEFAAGVAVGIENADDDAKRRIIDLFDTRIEIKAGRVFLSYLIQAKPIELHTQCRLHPAKKIVPEPRAPRSGFSSPKCGPKLAT